MKLEPGKQTVSLNELKFFHKNPRQISKSEMENLKKSLRDFPEMLSARPIVTNTEGEVLGGNMRLRALRENGGIDKIEVLVVDWGKEKQEEFVIKDNIANGEWEWDILANSWDEALLNDWGLETPSWDAGQDMIESASDNTVKEYSDDTDYNLKNLYREKINEKIKNKIEVGIEQGAIRPEIADILQTRANQCSIFNFDEIIKFYRSDDASELEKELLRRLYLVFITPKEAFEEGMYRVTTRGQDLTDDELMQKTKES